jgi:hypothetical protein
MQATLFLNIPKSVIIVKKLSNTVSIGSLRTTLTEVTSAEYQKKPATASFNALISIKRLI